ncbi:MAG: hypothetical protein F6K52_25905 [Moorea sp. SIO3H5]|nr:hypothetical protein [Moorena sp. SIO3H5]
MPLAFPSWEGLGVGSSCLLPLASSLFPDPLFPDPLFPKIIKLCTSPN